MRYLLTHAVEQAADRDPDAEAVRCGDERLTWGAMAESSVRLARVLGELGVRRGDRVAILARKGVRSGVAIHGIQRAGAAYVPLDPFAPPARHRLILEDCGVRHVVADGESGPVLRKLIDEGVALDAVVGADLDGGPAVETRTWSDVAGAPASAADPGTIELDLAYVLYTSGSTGMPKGVTHTHRSALAFAEIAAHTYGFRPDDRLSNHAPLHFDLSTMDWFSAAVAGASTLVIPEAYTRLPASLSGLIEEQRPTVLYVVPLVLVHLLLHGALDRRDLSSLRWVLFGGEPCPPKHLRALMERLPEARFSNVYGPTEVNGVTGYEVPRGSVRDDEPIPIGRPYGNVQIRIVDEAGTAVADGDSGELWVRTPSMMRGYWARPDLDARAFVDEAAPGGGTVRFHRTGDLVRRRPDGLLEFLGRRDRQIKTRGYRVELDEVEAALGTHEAVAAAAVFGVPDADGSTRIHGAVTLRDGTSVAVDDLRRHAAATLPSYALPERLSILETMPRTSSGKIDRLALRDRAVRATPTEPKP